MEGRPMTALRRPTARRAERGDVPGWVLITLMTAALVAALWTVAENQLVALFQEALASVRG
ncbi:hypothetical protein EPD83_014395 [Phycicoccus sp. CMS6Z-2]|nr:hypothetical protein [Phycicoccus flavus]